MTVKELKDALKDAPDDAEVVFDTLSTDYFRRMMDLFGKSMEYMPGEIVKAVIDPEGELVWLQA